MERGTGGEEVVEVEEVGWARGAGQQAGGLSPLLPLPSLSLSRHKSKPPMLLSTLSSRSHALSLSLSLSPVVVTAQSAERHGTPRKPKRIERRGPRIIL